MMGRNMKKATGRLAGQGKKTYAKMKERELDRKLSSCGESFRKNAISSFRVRCIMVGVILHFFNLFNFKSI